MWDDDPDARHHHRPPHRHHRPRLRRAAARPRVRRGRPRGHRRRRQRRRGSTSCCAGRSPIDDISDERLAAALAGGLRVRRRRTSRSRRRPTPSSCACRRRSRRPRTPTSGPVMRPPRRSAPHLRAGQLIVLQSTTFPGTTIGPFREVLEASGLRRRRRFRPRLRARAGEPRRPGQRGARRSRVWSAATTPAATTRAAALLRRINDQVVELSSPDAAELAKLLENVFRNVNIALVNQLALLCERMGLDVWEVIDAAATKPFGFMRFTPGPGRRRPLHPGRPVLPVVAGARVRLHRPLHRARRRHQPRDAAPRRRPRRRGAQRARPGAQGRARSASSAWRSSRTSRTRGTRRPPTSSRGSPSAARDVRFHDPHVAAFRDAAGVGREGVDARRAPRLGRRRRRRDRPPGDRLGPRLRARRPRRRHRRQLARVATVATGRSCAWAPAGRPVPDRHGARVGDRARTVVRAPSSSSRTPPPRTRAACAWRAAWSRPAGRSRSPPSTGAGAPDEEHDGEVLIRRYRPPGSGAGRPAADAEAADPGRCGDLVRARRPGAQGRGPGRSTSAAGGRRSRRELPPADLYHAFGILTSRRDRPRRRPPAAPAAGGRVVYDVIDVDPRLEQLRPACRGRCSRWYRRQGAALGAPGRRGRDRQRADRRPLRPRSGRFATPPDGAAELPAALGPADAAARPDPRGDRHAAGARGSCCSSAGSAASADSRRPPRRCSRLDDAALVMLGFGAVGRRAPRPRRRPALRRPPLHAAAGPSGRRPGVDRVGRRLDHRRARQLAEPAPVDAEQVLGEPDGGHAGRRRPRPRGDARDRRGRPAGRHRRPGRSRGPGPRPARDPGPGRGGLRAPRCLTASRDRYAWEVVVQPYLELVERLTRGGTTRPGCRVGRATAAGRATMAPMSYQASEYWGDLHQRDDTSAVGQSGLPAAFNAWLYRILARNFSRGCCADTRSLTRLRRGCSRSGRAAVTGHRLLAG